MRVGIIKQRQHHCRSVRRPAGRSHAAITGPRDTPALPPAQHGTISLAHLARPECSGPGAFRSWTPPPRSPGTGSRPRSPPRRGTTASRGGGTPPPTPQKGARAARRREVSRSRCRKTLLCPSCQAALGSPWFPSSPDPGGANGIWRRQRGGVSWCRVCRLWGGAVVVLKVSYDCSVLNESAR